MTLNIDWAAGRGWRRGWRRGVRLPDVLAAKRLGHGLYFDTESHLGAARGFSEAAAFWRMMKKAKRRYACVHFLPAVLLERAVSS